MYRSSPALHTVLHCNCLCVYIYFYRTYHGTIESQSATASERGQGKPVLPCSKAGERGTGFRSKDLGGAVRASGEATTLHYSAGGGTGTRGHSLMAKGQKGWHAWDRRSEEKGCMASDRTDERARRAPVSQLPACACTRACAESLGSARLASPAGHFLQFAGQHVLYSVLAS